MKFVTALIVAAGLIVAASTKTLASAVKVIANSSVKADSVSATELKDLFLQEKISIAGSRVEVVLQKGGAVHEAFLREFIHKSDDTMQSYYRALVFTGRGSMPRSFGSDAQVVAYVARTRGAIGYVSEATDCAGVKTLFISDGPQADERKAITRIEPEYPKTLLRMQIGGTVRLRVTISPKGSVEQVEVIGGNPVLAEAAETAVKQWVYTPGAGRTIIEVSVPFDPNR